MSILMVKRIQLVPDLLCYVLLRPLTLTAKTTEALESKTYELQRLITSLHACGSLTRPGVG